ncbi:clavaminate synthase-like protein [Tanacetum coccineum]
MAEKLFREIRVTQQKDCNRAIFLKIPCKLSGLTDSIKASKSWLELQLHQHGAILFRGFPVSSAFDFNQVVEAFGYGHIPYIGGAAIRIRYDETRNRNTWFNMLVSASGGFENELNDDPTKAVTFGNGQSFPAHVVHDCSKIMDEECVAIPWQKGDVLMLDNLAVLHARLPLITPPRRILASLCK